MANELTKDIAELENIRKSVTRGNVQTFLDDTLKEWKLKLDKLSVAQPAQTTSTASDAPPAENVIKPSGSSLRPLKKLTTYAFDESDKYVKLYYTVGAITAVAVEKISSKFTENSFYVLCTDINGVDYEIAAKGLLHPIDADKSSVKIKSDDNLLVMLKKKTERQTWNSLLKLDNKKEPKVPDLDPSGDPGDSMMSMMKKMYDDGDDEMKRTIRKAWHESQSKKADFSSMGGGDF